MGVPNTFDIPLSYENHNKSSTKNKIIKAIRCIKTKAISMIGISPGFALFDSHSNTIQNGKNELVITTALQDNFQKYQHIHLPIRISEMKISEAIKAFCTN